MAEDTAEAFSVPDPIGNAIGGAATPPDDATIAEVMGRAWAAAAEWSPDRDRCWAFPHSAGYAAATMTAGGWCEIGFVRDIRGERGWSVWWNARTGEWRLRRNPK